MRIVGFLLVVSLLSSCLTGAMRWNTDRRVRNAAEFSQSCEYYARGEENRSQIGMWDAVGMISAPVLDVGIIYSLSLSNPWYGFGYLVLGYPMAAAERFPPWSFGRWCGSAQTPHQPPYEYYYMLESTRDSCELTEQRERYLDALFLHSQGIKVNWQHIENGKSPPALPVQLKRLLVPAEEGICVYAYYMPGGEEAFKKGMQEPNED